MNEELFGELHEEEQYGLHGIEHHKQCFLQSVSERCCSNCKHFGYESACSDQPYPEFWCGKNHWDGIDSYDSLDEHTDCEDFNAR